ncbi:MAG: zinc-binding dehydrogenase [Myxococcales bacterium]|nr:zinc-binding dehydrogenase [Myxococcales bacterium]
MALGEVGQRVVVTAFGADPMDALENTLRVEAQPAPDPAELGPQDVVVRVRACAVGWVDLLMASGQYQHMVKPPYTPGLEYSGDVAWVGEAVDGVAVGDRVYVDGLLAGPRSLGAYQTYGGFATWAVAPAAAVRPLPEAWSYDQGCCLLGNYETAWHCLVARGQVQAGETVLVHGASGSTGLAAVHVAKLRGATVIATGRSPEKLAIVKAQGADHVVCTADAPRFREAVKELTGGRGVDVVYDGVGGETSIESLRCVRFGARFLIVGWASTPDVARGKGQRGAPNANVLPTNLIMMKGLDVLGCPTAISTHLDPSIRAARLGAIMAWVESGDLAPYAGPAYGFAELAQALRDKWRSAHVGGCILRP